MLDALDALERLHRQVAAVVARGDYARRHELIALRRELAACNAKIGELGERLFDPTDEEARRGFRERLSHMRSRTALHQAQWPAVRLGGDDGDTAYHTSRAEVGAAASEFINWTRATLARLQAGGEVR